MTEHNAEINAGFIVAFASSHNTAVSEDQWRIISDACRPPQYLGLLQEESNRLADLYWDYVSDFPDSRRSPKDMDSEECAAWVQSGLALTPFAGCVTKYTCDWTIAWSLIGEWASKEISCHRLESGLAMDTPRTYWKILPFFFSPMPLLLAYGTMGIEMAIAPLWVERQIGDDRVIKRKLVLYTK